MKPIAQDGALGTLAQQLAAIKDSELSFDPGTSAMGLVWSRPVAYAASRAGSRVTGRDD